MKNWCSRIHTHKIQVFISSLCFLWYFTKLVFDTCPCYSKFHILFSTCIFSLCVAKPNFKMVWNI